MPNEIFYIHGSKGRFYKGYEERGYVPVFEPGRIDDFSEDKVRELEERIKLLEEKLSHLENKEVKGELLFLRNKLNEHLDASRKYHRDKY